MTLQQIVRYTALVSFALLPVAAGAQNEVWRYYEARDTLVIEAEGEAQIPSFSTMLSKAPIPLQLVPAGNGIVLKSLFDSQNGVILSDAIRNISGVNVQSEFGVHEYFLIRGLNSLNNGLILTDGSTEIKSTIYKLYNIERIEVLKGPGAFLYGGNTLSGTVNMWRKQPVFRNFLRGIGSVGYFRTFRGAADLNLACMQTGLAFRLNAYWHETDNYRDAKSSKQFAVNPAFTWRINQHTDVTANFEYAQNDFQPDAGLPLQFSFDGTPPRVPEVPRRRSYQSPFDDSDQKTGRLRLDFSSKLSDALTLRNKFYHIDHDWQSIGTLLFGAAPTIRGDIAVQRALQQFDARQKLLGNQLDLLLFFNTGGMTHKMVAGFEFTRYKDRYELRLGNIATMDLFDPVETTPNILQIILLPFSGADARTLVYAPYVVDQISLSSRLYFFLGGRFDLINYDDIRFDFDSSTLQSVAAQTNRTYKKLSPMAGLTLAALPSLSFYASAGRSFAPPSTLTPGNPEPEESEQCEIGTKMRNGNGTLSASLAFYHLRKENLTIPDETGVLRQTGKQRSRGVELDIIAQPFAGVLTSLAYAFTEANLTEFRDFVNTGGGFRLVNRSGNRPPFAPKHLLNFWTTISLRYGIGFGAGMRFVSDQFISEANRFKIESYVLIDAALFFRRDTWSWRLNFKNLTNKTYFLRGFGDSSVLPADPFTAYSTIEFQL